MQLFGKTAVMALAVSASITGAAVRAEGTVTVYTAAPQQFVDALVPMFEEQSGTKVEIIKAGSGELLNRLTAESAKPIASPLLNNVETTIIDQRSVPPGTNPHIPQTQLLKSNKTWNIQAGR